MSSDLFVLDDSANFFNHSSNNSPDMAISSSDGGGDLFFSADQLCSSFPGGDSFLDIFEEFKAVANNTASFSPSNQLQSLTIDGYNSGNRRLEPENFYGGNVGMDTDVKTEECHMGLESFAASYGAAAVDNTNNGGVINGGDNLGKPMMQRSYSGNSFVGGDNSGNYLLQPRFHYQNQLLSSPESNFLAGQLRRVCSTGDLQNTRRAKTMSQRSLSSPLAMENSIREDSQMKVGRYSAEERQERILKYRAKRSQRNFNKTIKYACRKTLADNRPRIRGRFARNDEIYGENIPKGGAACSSRDDDEDELWQLEGLHEEEMSEGKKRGVITEGSIGSSEAQFQFYGY